MKFHFGHEFGALGLLCQTATGGLLFPVWVKLIVPETVRDKEDAVLKRICSKLPRGLIIFDGDFARRKVFRMLLGLGHHILCRVLQVNCGVLSFTETSETSRARASEEIWRPSEYPPLTV